MSTYRIYCITEGILLMIIMNNMIKLGNNNLQSKILIALFLSIISPFKTELIILSIMIVIDTITGSLYAMKMLKFSSTGLKEA